jgi:predicted nucleic acid-binding protein
LARESGPFVLSPFVLAELDDLLTKLLGSPAALRLLEEVARGAYSLAPFAAGDVARAKEVIEQHPKLAIGLADASLVVLSERHGTLRLLSLDDRHLRSVRGAGGKRFSLLPRDS